MKKREYDNTTLQTLARDVQASPQVVFRRRGRPPAVAAAPWVEKTCFFSKITKMKVACTKSVKMHAYKDTPLRASHLTKS